MEPERMVRPPSEQWWTINGQTMLDAMHRCRDGEDPEIMYLELLADCKGEDFGR